MNRIFSRDRKFVNIICFSGALWHFFDVPSRKSDICKRFYLVLFHISDEVSNDFLFWHRQFLRGKNPYIISSRLEGCTMSGFRNINFFILTESFPSLLPYCFYCICYRRAKLSNGSTRISMFEYYPSLCFIESAFAKDFYFCLELCLCPLSCTTLSSIMCFFESDFLYI